MMAAERIRPFDWVMLVVEVLVLVLIAVEVAPALRHRMRAKKRQKVLFALLVEGQAILNRAPSPFDQTPVHSWSMAVDAWSTKVLEVLIGYTGQAVAAFNHQSQGGARYQHIPEGAWPAYGKITARIENLRNIIEKPEIYY